MTDIGPQNVLGKRPSLIDPLVQDLISKIEPFIGKTDIEFEGRLGVLCLPNIDKKLSPTRLPLPVITETVIESSGSCTAHNGKPFKYEFVPSLEKVHFDKIQSRMEQLKLAKFLHAPPNPVFKVINSKTSHTVDEIYKKPIAARFSFEWSTYGTLIDVEPIEIISKETIEKVDVWSGHYPDIDEEAVAEEEGQTRHPYDFRVAINRERKLENSISISDFSKSDCIMIREKRRTTYDMKAWVVDLTQVTVTGLGDKYEVEIELKMELLFEQLERKAKGKPHGAFQILNDFLYFLRDLCLVFGPCENLGGSIMKTIGGFKYPEMTSCEPSEEKKRKYEQVTGETVFPIIGDYIYEILSEVRPS